MYVSLCYPFSNKRDHMFRDCVYRNYVSSALLVRICGFSTTYRCMHMTLILLVFERGHLYPYSLFSRAYKTHKWICFCHIAYILASTSTVQSSVDLEILFLLLSYVCMYVRLSACLYVSMYACMSACISVYPYVWLCIHAYTPL